MILEVCADVGLVQEDLDPVLAQVVGGTDAGEHKQLRRGVGASGQDHLAAHWRQKIEMQATVKNFTTE